MPRMGLVLEFVDIYEPQRHRDTEKSADAPGGAVGTVFEGDAEVGEAFANLVGQREVFRGAGFVAERDEEVEKFRGQVAGFLGGALGGLSEDAEGAGQLAEDGGRGGGRGGEGGGGFSGG